MRLSLSFAVFLLGVGCQSGGRYVQSGAGSPPAGTPLPALNPCPANPSAPVVQTFTTTGHSAPAAPAPVHLGDSTLIPTHVQTTTSYATHCTLSVDYLAIRLPFPHLRIFTGPDKVVTQTDYVRARTPLAVLAPPSIQPAGAPDGAVKPAAMTSKPIVSSQPTGPRPVLGASIPSDPAGRIAPPVVPPAPAVKPLPAPEPAALLASAASESSLTLANAHRGPSMLLPPPPAVPVQTSSAVPPPPAPTAPPTLPAPLPASRTAEILLPVIPADHLRDEER
jgi:hypothetical protein